MKRFTAILMAALAVALLGSSGDGFASAVEKARANEASPEGRAYAGPLGEGLGPPLQHAMQKCFPKSTDAVGTSFTMVFAIRENGTVEKLMVRPEAPATRCVLEEMKALRLAAPPHPGWWIRVGMKVTP